MYKRNLFFSADESPRKVSPTKRKMAGKDRLHVAEDCHKSKKGHQSKDDVSPRFKDDGNAHYFEKRLR